MNLEFHPLRQSRRCRKPRESHGLFGIHRATGVGKQQVFFGINEVENVGIRITLAREVGAPQGHRHNLRTTLMQGIAHELVGRKFSGAQKQAGADFTAGDDEW